MLFLSLLLVFWLHGLNLHLTLIGLGTGVSMALVGRFRLRGAQ